MNNLHFTDNRLKMCICNDLYYPRFRIGDLMAKANNNERIEKHFDAGDMHRATVKLLAESGGIDWVQDDLPEGNQLLFFEIFPKFNLKRNIFIRSITPHGVSDSLNIYEVYC